MRAGELVSNYYLVMRKENTRATDQPPERKIRGTSAHVLPCISFSLSLSCVTCAKDAESEREREGKICLSAVKNKCEFVYIYIHTGPWLTRTFSVYHVESRDSHMAGTLPPLYQRPLSHSHSHNVHAPPRVLLYSFLPSLSHSSRLSPRRARAVI